MSNICMTIHPGDVMLGDTMNASVCAVFACGGVMDDGGDGGDG